MSIGERIADMKAEMHRSGIDPVRGLGDELFRFASTLTPIVNVDLLVGSARGELLLAWRDDPHCGRGWHVPGGCIRLNETFETRLQKTARAELGVEIAFDPAPVGVFEIFSDAYRAGIADQRERAHFVTLAFRGVLPEGVRIDPARFGGETVGSLRWFAELPENFLPIQNCYKQRWDEIRNKIGRIQ